MPVAINQNGRRQRRLRCRPTPSRDPRFNRPGVIGLIGSFAPRGSRFASEANIAVALPLDQQRIGGRLDRRIVARVCWWRLHDHNLWPGWLQDGRRIISVKVRRAQPDRGWIGALHRPSANSRSVKTHPRPTLRHAEWGQQSCSRQERDRESLRHRLICSRVNWLASLREAENQCRDRHSAWPWPAGQDRRSQSFDDAPGSNQKA